MSRNLLRLSDEWKNSAPGNSGIGYMESVVFPSFLPRFFRKVFKDVFLGAEKVYNSKPLKRFLKKAEKNLGKNDGFL